MFIKSRQNEVYRKALKLKDKKFRNEFGSFLVEGKKQIEAISFDWEIEVVFVTPNFDCSYLKNCKPIILPENLFNKLVNTKTPQGIVAVVKKNSYQIEKIVKKNGVFVLLESLQDPSNIGSIIRCADAFGAAAVFVSAESADIYCEKAVNVSMGSLFHLPVIDNVEISDILYKLKNEKIKVFAASLKAKKFLNEIKIPQKSAFLIGNESKGLKAETEKLVDDKIKIKMKGKAESLNAAIAASIIMYEYQCNSLVLKNLVQS
ncbi:MAG: RNA methyltransferase [Elusimicrobiota bacterium]|jgi:TrmH family RNA methyltransferase|nr:RNA methyltransferase [Elusimicrobiota bacterium]